MSHCLDTYTIRPDYSLVEQAAQVFRTYLPELFLVVAAAMLVGIIVLARRDATRGRNIGIGVLALLMVVCGLLGILGLGNQCSQDTRITADDLRDPAIFNFPVIINPGATLDMSPLEKPVVCANCSDGLALGKEVLTYAGSQPLRIAVVECAQNYSVYAGERYAHQALLTNHSLC